MGPSAQTKLLGGGQQVQPTNRLSVGLICILIVVSMLLRHSFQADSSYGKGGSASSLTLPGGGNQACNVSTQYLPSDLEQLWMKNAASWEADFCNHMAEVESSTRVWLDTLVQHTQLQENQTTGQSPAEVLAQHQKMDPKVFSRFKTTYDCGRGKTTERITWLEPLSHGLRHPNALCDRGADIMDRKYLLLAHQADQAAARQLGNMQCANRACQAMYFDLGATTLQPSPQEAGQGWFFSAYKRQGIAFDRFLLWEAVTRDPAEVFQHVPKADMHKYQAIAQPGDFIVFKLDIDNYAVEHAILEAFRKDPQALALIDEFFFEEHVSFAPMLPYWGGTVGEGTSLASSYALFSDLRKHGMRAHSWV